MKSKWLWIAKMSLLYQKTWWMNVIWRVTSSNSDSENIWMKICKDDSLGTLQYHKEWNEI